jgi:chromosome segregation ATPase
LPGCVRGHPPVGILLNQYCSEGSFDTLKAVVGENEQLKRDTAKLQTAYDTNIQALSRHHAESKRQKDDFEKRLSSQRAQNEATLKGKQAVQDNIKKHKAELATLQDKLEGQSSSVKQLMNEIKKKESIINSLEVSKALQQEKMTKAEQELVTLRSVRESMQSR